MKPNLDQNFVHLKISLIFTLFKQSEKVSDVAPQLLQDVGGRSTIAWPTGVASPSFMLGNWLT